MNFSFLLTLEIRVLIIGSIRIRYREGAIDMLIRLLQELIFSFAIQGKDF
jgi:hypothetical protein